MEGIVILEGADLHHLLALLGVPYVTDIYRLRVCVDEGGAKVKVNEGMWTPALGKPVD